MQRDLGIPVPYAFNYHFDQGIFRGLAFANFHTPAEANEVVAALNGLDVSGRKLRVEYKKVLQAGEKERIEKEKAIKRMNTPHGGDKERKKDKSLTPDMAQLPALSMPCMPVRASSPNPSLLNGFSSPSSASSVSPLGHREHKTSDVGGPPFSRYDAQGEAPLDLNDAGTLEIYSRVLLFKDDRMRDELSFSKCLTPVERRTVHLVAQKLGLYHYNLGGPDDCYVLVTKFERPMHASPGSEPYELFPLERTARPDLRGKKSVPDLKHSSFHDRDTLQELERAASPAHRNLLAPTANVGMRKSNTSLRENFAYPAERRFDTFGNFPSRSSGTNVFASPFDIPVVPHVVRPNSVDIERLDQYHKPAPSAPFRARSPLAPGVHTGASTPVPPMAHSTGALDTTLAPSGVGAGLPHRPLPTRNMPVDLMLDGHATRPRSRLSTTSNTSTPDKREGRKPYDANTMDDDTNLPRPAPPTITKTSTIDEPSYL